MIKYIFILKVLEFFLNLSYLSNIDKALLLNVRK